VPTAYFHKLIILLRTHNSYSEPFTHFEKMDQPKSLFLAIFTKVTLNLGILLANNVHGCRLWQYAGHILEK